MGPIFYEKSLTMMGLIFKILKISCVFAAKWQEMGTFLRKNPLFWVPIFGKTTPEHGYGF